MTDVRATLAIAGVSDGLPAPVDVGQTISVALSFATPSGVAVAATGVTLTIEDPAGSPTTIAAAAMTDGGIGRWTLQVTLDRVGLWRFRGACAGPSGASAEGVIRTMGSLIDPISLIVPPASGTGAGLLSAADKAKLDGIATGATRVTAPGDIGAAAASDLTAESSARASGDTAALNGAKSYADTGDVTTLAAAQAYADTGLAGKANAAAVLAKSGDDATGVISTVGVANIAALRARAYAGLSSGSAVTVRGYYADNDGGGGVFLWGATSTATDDGGLTINPTGNAGAGRWVRFVLGGIYTPEMFGAKGDASTAIATATLSGTTLTTAAYVFNTADVGKTILVSPRGGTAFSTTIAARTSGTQVTLTSAPTSFTSTVTDLTYATDDSAAINQAISSLPAAAELRFSKAHGCASSIVYNSTKALRFVGGSLTSAIIYALAPMTALFDQGPSMPTGSTWEGLTFDGRQVATYVGRFVSLYRCTLRQVLFNNAAAGGANIVRGDGTSYGGVENVFWIKAFNQIQVTSGTPTYANGAALPLYNLWIRKCTDDSYYEFIGTNASSAHILADTSSNNNSFINPHCYAYNSGGSQASYVANYLLWAKAIIYAYGVKIDTTATIAGVQLDTGSDGSVVDLVTFTTAESGVPATSNYLVQSEASVTNLIISNIVPPSGRGQVNIKSPRGTGTIVNGYLTTATAGAISRDLGIGNTFGSGVTNASAIGSFNQVQSNNSTAFGANGRTTGNYGATLGSAAYDHATWAGLAWASRGLLFNSTRVKGSAQALGWQGFNSWSGTTAVAVTSDGSTAGNQNQILVPSDTSGAVSGWYASVSGDYYIMARASDTNRSSYLWQVRFVASRNSTGIRLAWSSVTAVGGDAALSAATVAASVDSTNGAIALTFTGVTGLSGTVLSWPAGWGSGVLMGS